MNRRYGAQSAQTPPKPTSTLASRTPSSQKTVRRSASAVAVGVLEDQDAIAQVGVEVDRGLGVGVVLGDPEPAAGVGGHRDRLADLGLGGEEGGAEALGQPHPGERLGGRRRAGAGVLGVVGLGEVLGDRRCREHRQQGEQQRSDAHGYHRCGRRRVIPPLGQRGGRTVSRATGAGRPGCHRPSVTSPGLSGPSATGGPVDGPAAGESAVNGRCHRRDRASPRYGRGRLWRPESAG